MILDNLNNIGNIYSFIRTAECLGLYEIHIIKNEECIINKNITTGAHKWIKINYYKNAIECLNYLKNNNFHIYAGELTSNCNFIVESLPEVNFAQNAAIMIGSETNGINPLYYSYIDTFINIPMLGLSQSLNAVISGTIIIYECLTRFAFKMTLFYHSKII